MNKKARETIISRKMDCIYPSEYIKNKLPENAILHSRIFIKILDNPQSSGSPIYLISDLYSGARRNKRKKR